jgi:type 1 glutamine amidotransferase
MSRLFVRLFLALLPLLPASSASSGPHRILYVTATYGFRHSDSIDASITVFQELAQESGVLEIDRTEDVSLLTADNLRNYDAVYFFTSGELPLSDLQKADLLDFVRSGKGFGGSHSATDCLYTWPDYGEMIGGYFDGHPWAQEAAIDVEDPQNPLVAHAAPGFRFTEEFYQFRDFSRDRVRVLMTLDTRSVDMAASGINRTDGDFALAWIRNYGKGRVFYSAFGHFPDSFRLPPVRTMLLKALLWLTGEIDADATPRSGPSAPPPSISVGGVRSVAGDNDAFAPSDIVVVTGDRLTSGSSLDAADVPLPVRLAGTHVEVNGTPAPLFSVQPDRLLVQLPAGLAPGQPASLTVSSVNLASGTAPLRIEASVPVIVAAVRTPGALVLYLTGLGATDPPLREGSAAPSSPLSQTPVQPAVFVGGARAPVFFSGLTPGLVGVYQINASIPADAPVSLEVVVESGGRKSNVFQLQP